ncbi:MAG: hypothetical protein ACOC93_05650, partial [Planctomycetota bacterium]
LDLRKGPEGWRRVWGLAESFNKAHHAGRVDAATFTDERIEVDLSVLMRGDPWTEDGRGLYEAELTRQSNGEYEGTFRGTFRGVPVEGRAVAEILPPRERRRSAYEPAEPGEHPRILLRKQDLPRLREKAKTPLGQAALARMNDAAGLAFRYQLTGERAYADRARKHVETMMADRGHGDKMVRSRPYGWRLEETALAYDMCYDAWDKSFRQEVEDYMVWASEKMFFHKNEFDGHIAWQIGNAYVGTILYGSGFAGLALWGEQGPPPAEPAEPFAGREANPRVVPAKAYEPGESVPVEDLRSGQMPGEWIYVGGFKPAEGEDPLAKVGGAAELRPEVGQKVSFGGRTETFRRISHEKDKGYWNGNIDITNAIGRVYFSTSYFYTVLRNDAPRWVRLELGHGGAKAWLNGTPVRSGEYVHLDKGLYPLLVEVAIGETRPWGRIYMRPRLVKGTEGEAEARVAAIRAEHEERRKDWQLAMKEWNRTGGMDPRFQRTFELSRLLMYATYRKVIGTGGSQDGSVLGMEGPHKYAGAYRTMFCEDVSPYPDATHYLPYKVFQHLYDPSGQTLSPDFCGVGEFATKVYIEPKHDVATEFFAPLLPIAPADWQPALLWAWHQHAGVTGPDDVEKVLRTSGRPYHYDLYQTHPLYVFLNYPLPMTPEHPSQALPKAWEAPGYGYYGFRNRWQDRGDFLVQVSGKSHVRCPAPAGSVRVVGLGQAWSHGVDRPARARWMENVVLLPQDIHNGEALGRVRYAKTEPDGSGVVTVDLKDVYAAAKTDESGRPEELYERWDDIRRPWAFQESGIAGLRSVAVDYSGLSGAACLIVLVDRIDGGGKKVWAWQLDAGQEGVGKAEAFDRETGMMTWQGQTMPYRVGALIREERETIEADPSVAIEEGGFTLRGEGASLRGTFVAPARPEVEFGVRNQYRIGYKRNISKSS